jgi:cyclopropane fatty-acyl-phospholipid synthase-like methyltransferase
MSNNNEQRDFWTAKVGSIWVDQRSAMDALFAGVLAGTLERAQLQTGQRVLDIGCGAGTSTLAVAKIMPVRFWGQSPNQTLTRPALLHFARQFM